MKRFPLKRLLMIMASLTLAHWPATAGACAACMGDVNSRTAPAINDAIFLMLGCIGFMLLSLGGFAFYLFKRANAPLPPHAQVAQTMNFPEDTP